DGNGTHIDAREHLPGRGSASGGGERGCILGRLRIRYDHLPENPRPQLHHLGHGGGILRGARSRGTRTGPSDRAPGRPSTVTGRRGRVGFVAPRRSTTSPPRYGAPGLRNHPAASALTGGRLSRLSPVGESPRNVPKGEVRGSLHPKKVDSPLGPSRQQPIGPAKRAGSSRPRTTATCEPARPSS